MNAFRGQAKVLLRHLVDEGLLSLYKAQEHDDQGYCPVKLEDQRRRLPSAS